MADLIVNPLVKLGDSDRIQAKPAHMQTSRGNKCEGEMEPGGEEGISKGPANLPGSPQVFHHKRLQPSSHAQLPMHFTELVWP